MVQPPSPDKIDFCGKTAKITPSATRGLNVRSGFAAITSVVLISGIALISSLSLAADYLIESREINNRASAVQARSSAFSCANIAVLRLKKNTSYTGNENISVDKVVCSIGATVINGNARTLYAQATVNGFTS